MNIAFENGDWKMKIPLDQVESAYNGKDGKCCCGCAGTHHREPRQIKRIYNKMMKLATTIEWMDSGPELYTLVNGNRLYILYMKGR